MPGLNADTVIKARWCVSIALTLTAIVLMITALVWAAIRIQPFQYQQRLAAGGFAPTPSITDIGFFGLPIALAMAAITLWLIGRFATRWIVSVPKPDCPNCRYDLSKPTSSVCPECGLVISVADSDR